MTPHEQLSHIKIVSQIQLNYLNDFKADNPNFFTGTMKNFTKNFIVKLEEIERKNFDKALNQQEEAATVIYDVTDEFLKVISQVHIKDMVNIMTIISAYEKDKGSIEGICKKILR